MKELSTVDEGHSPGLKNEKQTSNDFGQNSRNS